MDDKKNTSKDLLLEAAERLFTERGYATVSTRDIADAAGVNLGSIQYYFGSKANLFVETVTRMMQGAGCVDAFTALRRNFETPELAAQELCAFIYSYNHYLLRPHGPQACRLIFRELFSDSSYEPEMFQSLVTTFCADFFKPLQDALVSLLGHIRKDLDASELAPAAYSVLGQCSFYFNNQVFLSKLRAADISQSPLFEQTAEHICRFSLRALGVADSTIDRVIPVGFEKAKVQFPQLESCSPISPAALPLG